MLITPSVGDDDEMMMIMKLILILLLILMMMNHPKSQPELTLWPLVGFGREGCGGCGRRDFALLFF